MSNQTHDEEVSPVSLADDVLAVQGSIPEYSLELLQAALEAKHFSRDPSMPGYTDMRSLKHALED